MKLTVNERCEQGTQKGVMIFRPGKAYPLQAEGEDYVVTHEPRIVRQRVKEGDKLVRKLVPVVETTCPKALIEKMLGLGLAKLED